MSGHDLAMTAVAQDARGASRRQAGKAWAESNRYSDDRGNRCLVELLPTTGDPQTWTRLLALTDRPDNDFLVVPP